MHKSQAVTNFRVEVQFTNKLPHGPYCELGQGLGTYVLHVNEEATVAVAKEVFERKIKEILHDQMEAMRSATIKVSCSATIQKVRCKGAELHDDSVALASLLESGEALEVTLRQQTTTGCILS